MKEFRMEYKKINSKQIFVEEEYQRLLDYNRVKRIIAKFNPNKVKEICVSYRDGKYWCFDGQHTMTVLKEMNDNKDLLVPCKVFYGMTKEDEAMLFASQCDDVVRPITEYILRAKFVGGDKDVITFARCVELSGLKCDFTRGQAFRKLICYSTAYKIFEKQGEEHLKKVLETIIEIWGGDKESLRKEIVGGLSVFIRTYEDEIKHKDLVSRLRKTTPTALIGQGNAIGNGGYVRYAIAIFNVYNSKTRGNRLDYKFK